MLASLIGTANLTSGISVSVVREANIERLVDEEHMTKETPGVREQLAGIVDDPDGPVLGECSEL